MFPSRVFVTFTIYFKIIFRNLYCIGHGSCNTSKDRLEDMSSITRTFLLPTKTRVPTGNPFQNSLSFPWFSLVFPDIETLFKYVCSQLCTHIRDLLKMNYMSKLCNVKDVHSRENIGRKIVKTLNLPLHKHASHIIVQENDDQHIKKNIRLKFPEFCKVVKFLEFSLQGIYISHFPCFPCSVGTLQNLRL